MSQSQLPEGVSEAERTTRCASELVKEFVERQVARGGDGLCELSEVLLAKSPDVTIITAGATSTQRRERLVGQGFWRVASKSTLWSLRSWKNYHIRLIYNPLFKSR